MFLKHLRLYLAPEGDAGGGDVDGDEFAQDLSDLEDIDDPDNPDSGEKDPASEKEQDDDLVDKDEKDLEGDPDDKDEKDEKDEKDKDDEKDDDEEKPDRRVSGELPKYSEIKAKYPTIFKEFPQLRSALFLAPKFQEVFADPETAQQAAIRVEEYDQLESSIVDKGDPTLLLGTLAENNPRALKRLIENFGESLKKVSSEDYTRLSEPIIEELLFHAARQGTRTGDKNLQLAARHIANFVFANGGEIPDITKRAAKSEPSDAEKQLEIERSQHATERRNQAYVDLSKEAGPEINKIITAKLDGLSSFERKQIIKETREEVDRVLLADKSFQNLITSLWKRAASSGYSDESKSRIKRAWLDRARTVAPSVRNRLRQEALDARNPNRGRRKEGEEPKDQKKRTFNSGGGQNHGESRSRVLDPKKIDWNKTSDMDILK